MNASILVLYTTMIQRLRHEIALDFLNEGLVI